MANTDGLSDEVVSSMLTMPTNEEEKQYRIGGSNKQSKAAFPRRAMSRREQMMEQLGEGESPSATVIRSSRAPKVQSSTAAKRKGGKAAANNNVAGDVQEEKNNEPMESLSDYDSHTNKTNHKPVMSSSCIRERPVVKSTAVNDKNSNNTSTTKRESRFKQRNIKNGSTNSIPTIGGFPSLDAAPVGTFTQRGRSSSTRVQQSPVSNKVSSGNIHQANTQTLNTQTLNASSGVGTATDSMLANMSLDDIRDGVDEIKSILSAESIAFLKSRGKQKKFAKSKEALNISSTPSTQLLNNNITTIKLPKHEAIQIEEKRAHDEKEKMAELLSSVRSPEDMDRVYKEALQIGLATELPSISVVVVLLSY